MYDNFDSLISEVLGDFLAEHGFESVSSQATQDGSFFDVIYESTECKLRLYDSRRGGEINCLMGAVNAPNDGDWTTRENRSWFYIRDLLEIGKGLSLEELQKLAGPPVSGRKEQLIQLRDLLVSGLDKALRNLRTRTTP